MSTIEISINPAGNTVIKSEHFVAYRTVTGEWEIAQKGLEWKYSITIYPGEGEELKHVLQAMGLI